MFHVDRVPALIALAALAGCTAPGSDTDCAVTSLELLQVSDPGAVAGWFNAVAVDGCTTHLAYLVDAGGDATVALSTVHGTDVRTEPMGVAGDDASGEIDLHLAEDGLRTVLYSRIAAGPGALELAFEQVDGSWAQVDVAAGQGDSGKGGWNALAVAGDGAVHVAWEDGGYGVGDAAGIAVGPEWADDLSLDVDLVLDGSTPVIAAKTDQEEVRIVEMSGATAIERGLVNDVSGNTGFDPALTVAPDGLHVVYASYEGDPMDLRHASAAGGWVSDLIDSGPGVGGHPRLAAEPDGTLHVAYADEGRGVLRYGWRTAETDWVLHDLVELSTCGDPALELEWDQDLGTPDLVVAEGIVHVSTFGYGALCLARFPVGSL